MVLSRIRQEDEEEEARRRRRSPQPSPPIPARVSGISQEEKTIGGTLLWSMLAGIGLGIGFLIVKKVSKQTTLR